MNAVEFVKDQGWVKSSELINDVPLNWCFACVDLSNLEIKRSYPSHGEYVSIADLENLVGSFETVGMWGGLPAAKAHLESLADRCANGGLESVRGQYKTLKKAIADVESVGGGV